MPSGNSMTLEPDAVLKLDTGDGYVGFKELADQGRLRQSWRLDTPVAVQKFMGPCAEAYETRFSSRGGCYVILRVPERRQEADLILSTIKNTTHLTLPASGRSVLITNLEYDEITDNVNTAGYKMFPQCLDEAPDGIKFIMLTRLRVDGPPFNMKHVGMLWV
jgi:hypothetical protein